MAKAVAVLDHKKENPYLPNGKRVSARSVAAVYKVAPSTLTKRLSILRNPEKHSPSRRGPQNLLTIEEEDLCVSVLCTRADRGHPMFKDDLKDMVECLVTEMPAERRAKMLFTNGRPGDKWVRKFCERHASVKFGRASKQEEIRYRHCNAEVFTTHLVVVHGIIAKHNLSAKNIANLDEAGCTPGKDVTGTTTHKVFTRALHRQESREPQFGSSCEGVTIMPVIFADGTTGPLLSVFKGESGVRSRTIMRDDGKVESQLITECLPHGAVVAYNSSVAGVNGDIFKQWGERFVECCRQWNSGGKPFLLLYDGYRSHLSHRVLSLFEKNNIIAYALPSHTSGRTQPLDISTFGPFKLFLNRTIITTGQRSDCRPFDLFDFVNMMTGAYNASFIATNIKNGFSRAGIWPPNSNCLLATALPHRKDNLTRILTKDELIKTLEEKKLAVAAGLDLQPKVLYRGFLSTEYGNVLTHPEAMLVAKKADEEYKQKRKRLPKKSSKKNFKRPRRYWRRSASWPRKRSGVPQSKKWPIVNGKKSKHHVLSFVQAPRECRLKNTTEFSRKSGRCSRVARTLSVANRRAALPMVSLVFLTTMRKRFENRRP